MNEAMAKATTFTKTTLTPTPAAERSLARTASMAEPRELRRSMATPEGDEDQGDQADEAEADPREGVAAPDAQVHPEQLRASRSWPARCPTMSVLRNHSASMAYAKASVTTPSVRPRRRRAGSPITTPITVATSAARSGAIGNGMCQLCVR